MTDARATDDHVVTPQLRRMRRALTDLGAPVPDQWVAEVDGDFRFTTLTSTQFDRLLCLLEDLADGRPVQVTVMGGGDRLFDPGAPAGPVATPRASSVHMVVPQ